MKPMNPVEHVLENASIQTHSEANHAVLNELLDEFAQVKQSRPSLRRFHHGRRTMLTTLIKPAAAAAILIAVFLGINHMDHQGVAWGQVVDNIEQASAYMFRLRTILTDQDDSAPNTTQAEWTVYLSEQYGFRMDIRGEGPEGNVGMVSWYVSPKQDTLTMVIPGKKQWTQLPYSKELAAQEAAKHPDRNPSDYIRRFMAQGYTELGRKTINGIVAEGIEVTDPPTEGETLENAVGRLWVDVDSDLPVLIEIEGTAGIHQVQWLMDFRWNDAVDRSVFLPDLKNYTALK